MSRNSLRVCVGLASACALLVAAQSPTPPVKPHPSLDRRYAVASGEWSAATVSLFNTWSAFDNNPRRHIVVSSPDHKKSIEVAGNIVTLHVGSREFDPDINNLAKHDAELGWSPDSTKYFITWSETG